VQTAGSGGGQPIEKECGPMPNARSDRGLNMPVEDPDTLNDTGVDDFDADDTVTGRVLCHFCGYDLMGVPVGGVCPGCQRSVTDTLRGDDVLSRSEEEIRRLREASNIVYYPAMLLSILGAVTLTYVVIEHSRTILEDIKDVFAYAYFMAMISPTVSLVGIFVLTRRRSPAYWAARYGTPRGIATVVTVVVVFLVGAGLALHYGGPPAAAIIQVSWFVAPNTVFLRGLGRLMRKMRYKKLGKFLNATSIWAIVLSLSALLVELMRWGEPVEPEIAGPRVALTWITLLAGIGLWIVVLRLLAFSRRTLLTLRPVESGSE
jgi:hypothetical protein